MKTSKLYAQNDDLKICQKKNERNKKAREKFAALSAEQKEAHRRKNREAYHRRKITKLLSKPLDPESVQPTKESNIKPLLRPASTKNNNDGVLMPQLTEQHLHDTVAKYDRSTLPGTSDTNVTTAFFSLIFSYLAPSIKVTMIINSVYPTLDQISRIVSFAFLLMKKVILQAPTTSIYARIVVQSMTKV
ncbi:unnamed protein product [Coffea canephora]|uniref:Uncharacterized protein n=1 Tax=Coffea canephora TaxID=49390 RepID=A0A068UAE0_COFCA|nr:unnamed protein product [Coffea canephora]